jgi:hypothetical protein
MLPSISRAIWTAFFLSDKVGNTWTSFVKKRSPEAAEKVSGNAVFQHVEVAFLYRQLGLSPVLFHKPVETATSDGRPGIPRKRIIDASLRDLRYCSNAIDSSFCKVCTPDGLRANLWVVIFVEARSTSVFCSRDTSLALRPCR